MDTISLLIQIPPREIAYLSFIIESYEGVAVMRTVDPREGIVEVMVPPSHEVEIGEILKDLAREFPVHRLPTREGVLGHDPEKEFLNPSQ